VITPVGVRSIIVPFGMMRVSHSYWDSRAKTVFKIASCVGRLYPTRSMSSAAQPSFKENSRTPIVATDVPQSIQSFITATLVITTTYEPLLDRNRRAK
jgi:hypothetical protein